jgi:hypothetical protein
MYFTRIISSKQDRWPTGTAATWLHYILNDCLGPNPHEKRRPNLVSGHPLGGRSSPKLTLLAAADDGAEHGS